MATRKSSTTPAPTTDQVALTKGLPSSEDSERLILGSVLLDHSHWDDVSQRLVEHDFVLGSHRKIFVRMAGLSDRKHKIDRITVMNELQRYSELEAVGGVSYLISLDDGLPRIPNLDSYIQIVREKSTLRQAIYFAQRLMKAALSGETTTDELITGAEMDLSALSNRVGIEGGTIKTPAQIMGDHPGGINSFLSPHLRGDGLRVGMPMVDKWIYGLEPGKVYVIAGRTGEGKSSLAMQWATHIAKTQAPVLFFTLEMDRDEQLYRMLCTESGVSFTRFKRGNIDQEERMQIIRAAGAAGEMPLYFEDTPNPTMRDLFSKTRYMVRKHGVRAVFIDQLQLMDMYNSGTGIKFRMGVEAIEYISPGIKNMGKSLGIPVVLLSHLSKTANVKGKGDLRPVLNDLKGSSSISQSADRVMFVYREELDFPARPEIRGNAELIFRKSRNGHLGTIHLRFHGPTTKFTEVIPESGQDED